MFQEDRVFDLRAGQTLVLEPGLKHGGTTPYAKELRFYWVHFTLAAERQFQERRRTATRAAPVPVLRVPRVATLAWPDRLTELFRRFLDDQEEGLLNPLQASLFVLLMLDEVANVRPREGDDDKAGLANCVQNFIVTHAHEPISTATIARSLRRNPDYLGRAFRKTHGMTVTDAVMRRRIRNAKSLLREGGRTVAEVAATVGYDDPGYLRRVFKRLEGMTPSAYRRLHSRMHVNTE